MKYIIIHHTGGTNADPLFDTSNQWFWTVNEYHRQTFNMKSSLGYYVGYNYFIDKWGAVMQARVDGEEGAHTRGYNHEIGICLAGNFDFTLPTQPQIDALKLLLERLVDKHGIDPSNIVPHRHFAAKSCYGRKLGDDWAQIVY